MARPPVAIVRLMSKVDEWIDDQHAIAMRDGVIDAEERYLIEQAREIGFALERGNLARLAHQEIDNSWDIDIKPRLKRRIREVTTDQSRIRERNGFGDHDPDDGAPQMRAA